MKLTFPAPTDGKMHIYCINCRSDGAEIVWLKGQKCYKCSSCGQVNDRAIYLGDKVGGNWWVNQQDGQIWHESAGVLVREPGGKFLFFERTDFPMGYTIPAGHVDFGEDPKTAAIRELEEEVGIKVDDVVHIFSPDIVGDSCIGGADTHRWHVYRADVPGKIDVVVKEEGRKPVWLSLEQAANKPKPFAVTYILKNFNI